MEYIRTDQTEFLESNYKKIEVQYYIQAVIMRNSYSFLLIIISILLIFIVFPGNIFSQTRILKWQDAKEGCVTLTFDDGSINQFRIALPLMNERGFSATFFINTGNLPGSKYKPTFVGRPIQEIISESKTVLTDASNLYERCSVLRYLGQIRSINEIKDFNDMTIGETFEEGKHKKAFQIVDAAFANLRKSGKEFKVEENFDYRAGEDYAITWDDLRVTANQGHEIANHTISHPYLPVMDKANILYEVEKCKADLLINLGVAHTLSIECPYGIEDDRVLEYVNPIYPFVRNRLTDPYIKEILRGDPGEPVSDGKEYVQWQRGPLSKTTISEMKEWIHKTINNNVWLLLVFHGIEGIGWEPLSREILMEYFEHIKAKEDHFWVATFQDAFKYIRERMNSSVNSKISSDIITVTLSHDLDQQIYNLPLTLTTEVPVSWESVSVQQGEMKEYLTIKKDGNIAFVQYHAVPNASKIIISKRK